VKLVVDEYGPWYKPGTENAPEQLLGQMITVRDAVMTAMSLDTFNRHADKVGMAACAQLVNNLNALFLTHGDKFATTPNFNVFEMYAAHQGGWQCGRSSLRLRCATTATASRRLLRG
jgi:alpha-N-arabinofuranosidase